MNTWIISKLSRSTTAKTSRPGTVTCYDDTTHIGKYTFFAQPLVAPPDSAGKNIRNYDVKTIGELFMDIGGARQSFLTQKEFDFPHSLKPASVTEPQGTKFVQRCGAGPYAATFRFLGQSKEDPTVLASFPVKVQWEVSGEVYCSEDTFRGESTVVFGEGGERSTKGSRLKVQAGDSLKEQLDQMSLWSLRCQMSDGDDDKADSSMVGGAAIAADGQYLWTAQLQPIEIIFKGDSVERTHQRRSANKGKGPASQASELEITASVSCSLDFTAGPGGDED